MENESIGIRLKNAREKQKLTQKNVCEELGIQNTQTLSAYERDNNAPPCEILKKLAVLYNVSTDWILFGTENIAPKEKTPFDYLCQIVEGVDDLGLKLKWVSIEESQYDPAFECMCIQLDSDDYPFLYNLSIDWQNLRLLRDKGTIDSDDYDTLMKKRLLKFKENFIEPLPF